MQRCSSWQFSLPPHCVASSGFVDGADDIGDGDLIVWPCQTISTARTTHAIHQLVATKLAEQLFEIGKAKSSAVR